MMKKWALCTVLTLVVSMTSACATKNINGDVHVDEDMFESYNRAVFKFNYGFDKYILRPVAEGYRDVTNEFTRERVSSVLSNIKSQFISGTICYKAI